MIGQTIGQLRVAMAHKGGGAGTGPSTPATPTLTAPVANANVFNTVVATVSATTTDTNLSKMEWVLDPAGANTVVATVVGAGTPPGTFSTTWTPTGVSDGAHLLVARATRAASSADSASITINVGEVLHTLVTSVTCLRAWQSDFQVHDAGGAQCDSWTDQKSGAAAIQPTGANQPAIVANAIGTRTALRFDGSNDFLRDATLDRPTPAVSTTFIWGIFAPISWTATDVIWTAGTTTGTMQLAQSGSTPQIITYDGTVSAVNAGAVLGTPARVETRFSNSTTLDYLKLGATTITASGASFGNLDPPAGWNMGAVSTGANAANCDIYVCLIFSGVPSGAELAALSAAAAAMYPGLAV